MGVLGNEARALQNPALGSVLLWKFSSSYYETHPYHSGPPLQLLFLVLPMVFQANIREVILGTRKSSSLRAFTEKFSSSALSSSDIVLSLQNRIQRMKPLTAKSLHMIVSCGMVTIDSGSGTVIPSRARGLSQQLPAGVAPLARAAEYLGGWTSQLSLYEIAVNLRLFF
jgi:hypothetical protein